MESKYEEKICPLRMESWVVQQLTLANVIMNCRVALLQFLLLHRLSMFEYLHEVYVHENDSLVVVVYAKSFEQHTFDKSMTTLTTNKSTRPQKNKMGQFSFEIICKRRIQMFDYQ